MTSTYPTIDTSTTFYHNDSRLVYGGEWNHNDTWVDPNGEIITFSSTTDISATLTIPGYIGPAGHFFFYGFQLDWASRWTICVDCHITAPNFILIKGSISDQTVAEGPGIIYSTAFQSSHEHAVVIIHLDRSIDQVARLTVTKLELVFPSNLPPSLPPTSPSSSTSAILLPTISSSTVWSSISSATGASPTSVPASQSATPKAGLIAAVVVGVLVLLSVLITILYCFVFRPRRVKTPQIPARRLRYLSTPLVNYIITPFDLPDSSSSSKEVSHPDMRTKRSNCVSMIQPLTPSDDPFAGHNPTNVIPSQSKTIHAAAPVVVTVNNKHPTHQR